MNIYKIGRVIAPIALSFLPSQPAAPQGDHRSAKSQAGLASSELRLTVTIRADREVFRMSDSLQLETQLTNAGTKALYLFDDVCWNPGNFLTIHAFAKSGKEVSGRSDFLRDCLPPPPRPDDLSRFSRVDPGKSFSDNEKFKIRELVPRPGEYTIAVYYLSAISKSWIDEYGGDKIVALPIWTRDFGEMKSNLLHITVKP